MINSQLIRNSQHCQRNWNLELTIPQEHIDLIVDAATQAPYKQNLIYHRVHVITDRAVIESIYNVSEGYNKTSMFYDYNPQILANLVIGFERKNIKDIDNVSPELTRNRETYLKSINQLDPSLEKYLYMDMDMAIGIAAGYTVLTANYLGYKTGFCKCFDTVIAQDILNSQRAVSVLLGIGFPDLNLAYNAHHRKPEYLYKTFPKEDTDIIWHR